MWTPALECPVHGGKPHRLLQDLQMHTPLVLLACLFVHLFVCMYVCKYVCMFVCVHVCIHV